MPAIELALGEAGDAQTVLVVNDGGRGESAELIAELLDAGKRVVAIDVFLLGEAKPASHGYLLGLLSAAVGERPLGIQASQLGAAARWLQDAHRQPVSLTSIGPRSSIAALVASALERDAIAAVELRKSLGSLKELIEHNHSVEEMPEMFCFGLLEAFDLPQIAALSAPRPVRWIDASPRAKAESAPLQSWYALFGQDHP